MDPARRLLDAHATLTQAPEKRGPCSRRSLASVVLLGTAFVGGLAAGAGRGAGAVGEPRPAGLDAALPHGAHSDAAELRAIEAALLGADPGASDRALAVAGPLAAIPHTDVAAEWQPILGGFGWLNDARAFSDEDVWAVGDGVVHYDGEVWRQLSGPHRPIYHAIDGFSSDALWIVGEVYRDACDSGGFILRRDDGSWRYEPIDTHQPLYDIQMLAPDDGWAVGGIDVPAILHYDGTGWRSVGAPETAGLTALQMLDERTGWAVGRDGAIVRYNGSFWEQQASPTTSLLMGVHMLDDTFGWAVGYDDSYRYYASGSGTIVVYENGRWWREPAPNLVPLGDVRTIARDRAIAVGAYGVLLWFDGAWWREIGRTYPGASRTYAAKDDAAWTADGSSPLNGEMLREGRDDRAGADGPNEARGPRAQGGAVDPLARPAEADPTTAPTGGGYSDWGRTPGSGMLHRIAALPDGETLLAVGDGGQVIVLDDRDWTEAHAGRQITAVDALTPDDVWVVGLDGPPLHWDGTRWSSAPTPRRAYWLNDVDVIAPDDAWAVGAAGAAAHWDGRSWSMAPRFTDLDLQRVSFAGPDQGWAYAGRYDSEGVAESFVYRFDGSGWRQAFHLCNERLSDVAASEDGSAWFATNAMALLRFDGRDWHRVPVPGADPPAGPAPRLSRLVTDAAGTMWGLGTYRGIARYDGRMWATVRDDSYSYENLYRSFAPAHAGDGRLWILGRDWAMDGSRWGAATLRLVEPGQPDQLAFQASPALADIASVPSPGGGQTVFLVGSGSTVIRYHTDASAGALPEPTATQAVSPPPLQPTPTPRSIVPLAQVQRTVLQRVDPDVTREVTLARTDLMTEREVKLAIESIWRDPLVAAVWSDLGSLYDCECAWRPLWLVEAVGKPVCYLWHDPDDPPSSVLVVVDATDGSVEGAVCLGRRSRARLHLPIAVGGIAVTPWPTATPRDLTPQPVEDVPGACPTPTPYVREPGSGYP